MTPAQYDFEVRRGSAGDYAAIIFEIDQLDGVTPVPLAGATVTLVITLGCGTTLVKSTANGGMILDPVAGTATWLPTVAETLAIAPGRIDTYDLTIAFPNGSIGPYMTGFIIGLDDGDCPPPGCMTTGSGLSSLVRVIKILVPGTPGASGDKGDPGTSIDVNVLLAQMNAQFQAASVKAFIMLQANGADANFYATQFFPPLLG